MGSLPTEVLDLIASQLWLNAVPNFRLASKAFAAIGARHLNIGKHFYFRKHSLEQLRQIASHSIFSQNLREIVFFIDVVPAFESKDEWESQARATCHYPRPLENHGELADLWLETFLFHQVVSMDEVPDRFKELGWQHQQKIRQEQDDLMLHSQTTFRSFQSSLASLPNLNAFSLKTFGDFDPARMRPLYILEQRQAWYCFNITCAMESFRHVVPQSFDAALASRNVADPTNRFKSFLSVLKVNSTDFVDFDQDAMDSSRWAAALENMQALDLKSIILDHRLDMFRDPSRSHMCSGLKFGPVLRQILVQMPKLQSLRLSIQASPELTTETLFKKFPGLSSRAWIRT